MVDDAGVKTISSVKLDADYDKSMEESRLISDNMEVDVVNVPEVKPELNFQPDAYDYRIEADRYFCCARCLVWFSDLNELIVHWKDEHKYMISNDVQNTLYKQWEEILQVEKSVLELIAVKKVNNAKKIYKSYLPMLDAVRTNVFTADDNIFKYFINSMKTRLKSLIKENKIANEAKIELWGRDSESSKIKKHENRKKWKNKSSDDKYSSEFSSEDELCLKDALKGVQVADIKLEDVVRSESPFMDDLVYYVVPKKRNGDALSLSEMNKLHTSIKDVMKRKQINLDQLNDVIMHRFDIEPDEIVPDDAIMITEWLHTGMKYKSWESCDFHNFLNKNLSSNLKKNKNIPSGNRRHDSDDDKERFYLNSNVGENLEVKLEVTSGELKLSNVNDSIDIKNECNEPDEFVCQMCNASFPYNDKLLQHEFRFHSKGTGCESCQIKFSTYEEKRLHMANHVENWPDLIKAKDRGKLNAPECSICFRKFTSQGRLQQHVNITHEGKPFSKYGRRKNSTQLNEDAEQNMES